MRTDPSNANAPRRSVRRKPYTWDGLRRLACVKCGEKATEQWNVRSCRAGVNWGYLPLCDGCDDELNTIVLDFFPSQERR